MCPSLQREDGEEYSVGREEEQGVVAPHLLGTEGEDGRKVRKKKKSNESEWVCQTESKKEVGCPFHLLSFTFTLHLLFK